MKHKAVASVTLTAALIAALAGCAAPASSPGGSASPGSGSSSASAFQGADVKVGFDNPLAYSNNMPVLIAIEQGFFKKQGLSVTTVGFSGGSDATRGLVSGSIDVQAGVGFDSVVGNANDLGVTIFYTVARDTDFVLYGSTAAGIAKPKDLKGSALGVSSFGSFSDYLARSTAGAVGLPEGSIKTLALGTNPALFGAIESGSVGGTWNPSSLASAIKGSVILGSTSDFKIPTQYSSMIARTDWLTQKSEVARRFARAIADAISWHQDKSHRDAAVEIAVRLMQLPKPAAEAGYDGASKIYTDDGKPSTKGLKAMADAVPTLGLGSAAPDVKKLATTDYLPAG